MTSTGGAADMAHDGYDGADLQRFVAERPKRPGRTAFERDRARVLHSAALRRLAAKTQVVVPWASDFPRTRLTHSLECAQVGRELGKSLGCDADLVEAACLAHDLGHPPFGHTGEQALDEFARACGGFEGNAQSLRILTRLEAKVTADDGRSVGLNLTRATLDAATKYPWPCRGGAWKYGVYDDDVEIFRWVREDVPDGRCCLEAQIMDWADDVAYSLHDLEDALYAGHVTPERLRDPGERRELVAVAIRRYTPGTPDDELHAALDRLESDPSWPARFDGSYTAQAALKNATSQLIGRFCLAAEQATRDAFGGGRLRRYGADLVVPREARLECAVLKAITARYVMERDENATLRRRQREIVTEIGSHLLAGAPATLEPAFGEAFERAGDDRARLRVVVDQVASLTDPSALAMHERLGAVKRSVPLDLSVFRRR